MAARRAPPLDLARYEDHVAQGHSQQRIADDFGMSVTTLRKRLQEAGTERFRAEGRGRARQYDNWRRRKGIADGGA